MENKRKTTSKKQKKKKSNSITKNKVQNNKNMRNPHNFNKSNNAHHEKRERKTQPDDNSVIHAENSFKGVSRKSIFWFSFAFFTCLIGLIGRLFYIQFIDGSMLKQSAYNQQTSSQIISPKRGNIYDSSGKALAISAQVDTVTINPSLILVKNDESATTLLKEKIALRT